jgi:hypothetical protein
MYVRLLTKFRYFEDPKVEGYIDKGESTVSLATTCVNYICKRCSSLLQSGGDISEDMSKNDSHFGGEEPFTTPQFRDNQILEGSFRFHYYAVSTWLELVERSMSSLPPRESYSDAQKALFVALEDLAALAIVTEEAIGKEDTGRDRDIPRHLKSLQKECPTVYNLIHSARSFLQKCSESEFSMKQGKISWLICHVIYESSSSPSNLVMGQS